MEKALLYLALQFSAFFALFLASGFFSGALGEALYYLAFLVPFFVTLALVRQGRAPYAPLKIKATRETVFLTVPLVAPTALIIFFVSWLSDLVFKTDTVNVSGNIAVVIATNALIPAILEEAFFRYLPLAILKPYSKKAAIFISATIFALVHLNWHQIVYAFIAGVIFAAADLIFDSIIPSVILHFVNNLISVIWLRYSGLAFTVSYIAVLAAAALVSLFFIYRKRERYKQLIKRGGRRANR